MRAFALWLSATSPSVFIQEHNTWAIPAIQSVHIVGIAMVMGSVLMIDLRILGWTWTDQTLRQTTQRFGPWLTGSLWLLLATGALMVIGEPERELVTFSFWLKMTLVACGALVACAVPAVAEPSRAAVGRHADPPRTRQGARGVYVPGLGRDHRPWTPDCVRPRLGQLVAVGEAIVEVAATLDWLQKTGLAIRIRDSLLLFPLLESAHVIGLAIVVGTVLIIDLRLLGLATMHRSFQRLAYETLPWTLGAFTLTAVTGALMFITNATVYFHNAYFRAKVVLLVLAALNALVFEQTTRRRVVQWDQAAVPPRGARAAAAVSLVIWIGVIVAGRMIGFTATRTTVTEPSAVEPDFEDLLGLPKCES